MKSMKQNGNNRKIGDYYLGLDIGTDSVGWAVTDTDYNLLRFKGNTMWGIRLFPEGNTAEERRTHRTNRRRLARRKWRLEILRDLFDEAITAVDPGFFQRMAESPLVAEDKTLGTTFSLFADPGFTDKDYHRRYPTVYHLRRELETDASAHDVRLVYLALHSLFKARGHFLYEVSEGGGSFDALLKELLDLYAERTGLSVTVEDPKALHDVLADRRTGIRDKAKTAGELLEPHRDEEMDDRSVKSAAKALANILCGGKTELKDLLMMEEGSQKLSLSDGEEAFQEAFAYAGDAADVLTAAKELYDSLILERITGQAGTVSEYKIGQYEQHKKDIRELKTYIRRVLRDPELYREVFSEKREKLNNYAAYSGYRKGDAIHRCSLEDFNKYLKGVLAVKDGPKDASFTDMFRRIEENSFAVKLRTSENGVIPVSLLKQEVDAILANAEKYLPFLTETDAHGTTVSEKIRKTFSFRIPYYVGPLSQKTDRSWIVRGDDPITPWNFDEVVDTTESARKFIERMTSRCTYTGDDVLPKDSLLYSRFTVLNEINNIQVNGKGLPVGIKQQLYRDLFEKKAAKVTKKAILRYLISEGLAQPEDVISGIDDTVKASLGSMHRLRSIIEKHGEATAEEIIRRIVLFGDDRKLLRRWLRENTGLSAEDIDYAARLKFDGWGRLSRAFLTEIYEADELTGEAKNIISRLWETNENLMQLLSGRHEYLKNAEAYRTAHYDLSDTPFDTVRNLYVSPKIRRAIWQALRIVDELADIRKCAPKKIFVEVARDQNDKNEKKRTVSRKQRLLDLYKQCKEDSGPLFEALEQTDESRLRSDKLFLYYTQFGKCMYSGMPIDIEKLGDSGFYDIDHIYPRSKIKDDSLDNRVLVNASLNRSKSASYPLDAEIRRNMTPFWHMLHKNGMISDAKLTRLCRTTELTDDELQSFVARQLVETRQSTKAVAELLQEIYPNSRLVYSKAGNVSDFRQLFRFVKCREVNDIHHAKDAYLNIVVGNYFDTRFTSAFLRNIRAETYSLQPETMYRKFSVAGAWQAGEDGTIATVKKMMAKNSVRYTRPTYEVSGALYDLQILKAGNGQIPIKKGLSIEKYGGYNKPTGSFFALVEYTEKGKKVRALESVYLADKARYLAAPVSYFIDRYSEKATVTDVSVILPCIPASSLIELDGVPMHITGRSDERILFNQAIQFVVDPETEAYIKAVSKYVERNIGKKPEEAITTTFDGVTEEKNRALYRLYVGKLETPMYRALFSSMLQHLKNSEGTFEKMPVLAQSRVLMEIQKAFRCTAEHPSLKDLCGVGKAGVVRSSMKINGCRSVILVHQSVTGLYEYRTDLLK